MDVLFLSLLFTWRSDRRFGFIPASLELKGGAAEGQFTVWGTDTVGFIIILLLHPSMICSGGMPLSTFTQKQI